MTQAKARAEAATLALWATVGLTAFKLGVAWVSGSVGVLSEGVHSFLDLVSAAVAFFSIREAGKPADQDHPFGHGKIETLSSLFESFLLIVAAVWIFLEGLQDLAHPHEVQHQSLAILTMVVAMVVSFVVYRHNIKAAAITESGAIRVNALHFLSDVVASIGVLVGLVVIKFTGCNVVDAFVAMGVGLYVFYVALAQVRRALGELSDVQMPEAELAELRIILDCFQDRMIEAHDLRTRRIGATRHVEFHLVVCGLSSVVKSHAVCDAMEDKIRARFPDSLISIHVEPCDGPVEPKPHAHPPVGDHAHA